MSDLTEVKQYTKIQIQNILYKWRYLKEVPIYGIVYSCSISDEPKCVDEEKTNRNYVINSE